MTHSFEESLRQIEAELHALPARELRAINVDLPAAAIQGIGVARRARSLRPQLVELFGEARVARTDRLELLSRALLCVHVNDSIAEDGPDVSALSREVHELRQLLGAEVDVLIARHLLPPKVTAELVRKHGHQNAAFDVLQLVSALRSHWDTVKDETGVTLARLDAAEGRAHELAIASARRARPERSASGDMRMRAFTVFFATYEELRRLVHCACWYEGDANRIAPPFWKGRPPKKKRGRNAGEG